MNLKAIKNRLSKRITLILVPDGAGQPRQIKIPLSLIVIILGFWTFITFWGSYLSARHVDYWRTKLSNEVLTLKVNYLINQLETATGFVDQVKQVEAQLKELLQYRDENSLTKVGGKEAQKATGGPTLPDQMEISQILRTGQRDISWDRLVEKVDFFKEEADARIDTFQKLNSIFEEKKRRYFSTPMGYPADGTLTSRFGMRIDPVTKEEEFHFGLDIANNPGTPIRATADGKVRLASWHAGYGNVVIVDHGFGLTTLYAHNRKLLVKLGDHVKRGQAIALMGSTGKASGPHSHYEVWINNNRQNPVRYLALKKFSLAADAEASKKNTKKSGKVRRNS